MPVANVLFNLSLLERGWKWLSKPSTKSKVESVSNALDSAHAFENAVKESFSLNSPYHSHTERYGSSNYVR